MARTERTAMGMLNAVVVLKLPADFSLNFIPAIRRRNLGNLG